MTGSSWIAETMKCSNSSVARSVDYHTLSLGALHIADMLLIPLPAHHSLS